MDMPGGAALTAPNASAQTGKQPTGFLDLPAELRNEIYSLSGCLKGFQCRICNSIVYEDSDSIRLNRLDKPHDDLGANKLQVYRFSEWPYIAHACPLKTRSSRNHKGGYVGSKYSDAQCGYARRVPMLWINRNSHIQIHHKLGYTSPQDNGGKLPAIASTCTVLRAEMLSIFIATHRIYATVFDAETDGADILRTMFLLGFHTVSKIKRFEIAYSKKQDLKYINDTLVQGLKAAGMRTDEGVVEVSRPGQFRPALTGRTRAKARNLGGQPPDNFEAEKHYSLVTLPMCKCEYCVVTSLRGKNQEQEKREKAARSVNNLNANKFGHKVDGIVSSDDAWMEAMLQPGTSLQPRL